MIMESLYQLLKDRKFLWLVLIINTGGTIYGYIWYEAQLAITPSIFLPFVPDSPTASLFFCFVLVVFLMKKNWPLMEALAAVTLVKYGVWAVVMNAAAGMAGDVLTWKNYMLIGSHLAMAIQGLLYAPFYRIKPWHLMIVAVWTLHNDIIDYVFGMYPWVSRSISEYLPEIGYFTFWLSIFSLLSVYILNRKQVKRNL